MGLCGLFRLVLNYQCKHVITWITYYNVLHFATKSLYCVMELTALNSGYILLLEGGYYRSSKTDGKPNIAKYLSDAKIWPQKCSELTVVSLSLSQLGYSHSQHLVMLDVIFEKSIDLSTITQFKDFDQIREIHNQLTQLLKGRENGTN